MPGRGGSRKGRPNKANTERTEKALAKHKELSPERMLAIAMNLESVAAKYQPKLKTGEDNPNFDEKLYTDYQMKALEAHKAAAPYFAARLSSIKHEHKGLDLTRLTDAQLIALRTIVSSSSVDQRDRPGDGQTAH